MDQHREGLRGPNRIRVLSLADFADAAREAALAVPDSFAERPRSRNPSCSPCTIHAMKAERPRAVSDDGVMEELDFLSSRR